MHCGKRNWQDLFDDVLLVNNGAEETHFIGSVVLYREKDRENGLSHYTIIDGQQRIITLAIMLSCIAFWLKCYSAEKEFNGTKQYIITRDDSDKDHIMVTSEYHISLERVISEIVKPRDFISFLISLCFNTLSDTIEISDPPLKSTPKLTPVIIVIITPNITIIIGAKNLLI